MTTRTIFLVLVALLFAGATAFFVRDRMQAPQPVPVAQTVQAPPKEVTKVLVAKADLPVGLLLKEEHLRWQSWPDENLDAAYIPEEGADLNKYYGAVVKRGIAVGQPLTESQIARPGDRGFLAAVLKPGMRAVSIGVNETTGVAGLVFPGDRVDILLTEQVEPGPGAPEGATARRATETVLENVRILALEQSLGLPDGQPMKANVATVEVTPKQAEMLALMTQIGGLSLALRSMAPDEEVVVDADSTAVVGRGLAEAAHEPAAEAATDAAAETATDAAEGGEVANDAAAPAATEFADPLSAAATAEAAGPWDGIAEPDRGSTYTMDVDVSRVLQLLSTKDKEKSEKRQVLISRGSNAETLEFE